MWKGGAYVLFLLFAAALVIAAPQLSAFASTKSRAEINIFLPGAADNPQALTSFESSLGLKFNAAMWYQNWSTGFDRTEVGNIYNSGHIPELTWEPQTDNGVGISYDAVVNGNYDSYLTSFAQGVASIGYPIRISLAPEMNTDWTPWGIGLQGNNAGNFITFYQHVVQKFRQAGATNVIWVWSPNVAPSNADQLYGNNYANLYPGDQYVDFMGLDGYNRGTSQSWSIWQSFSQVFQSSYQQLIGISSKKILIMEIASAESGGSKAAWITDMFSQLQSGYSHIQGFTWFNINKETDWRINSSNSAQAAFTAGYTGEASGSTTANSGGSTSGSSSNSSSTTSSTPPVVKYVAPKTPISLPSQLKVQTTTANPADQKYPVTSPLPPKIAGTVVASAAMVRQLNPSELGLVIATTLAGLLMISFLTTRRYRSLHHQPLRPVGVVIERFLGLGLVDNVFHRSHFDRLSNQKKNHLR